MKITPEQSKELYYIVKRCWKEFRKEFAFPANADRLLAEIEKANKPLTLYFCMEHEFVTEEDNAVCAYEVNVSEQGPCDIRTFVEKK